MNTPPIILTIAGSDSGGGAGIQADLKTFSALGCYGTSAITSLTAQNTMGVQNIQPIPPEFIAHQIDSVIDDFEIEAVKIGMLHSKEVINTVNEKLIEHKIKKVVLDPVMVAESGDNLLEREAIISLKEKLIPNSLIITPNIYEAEILLNNKIEENEKHNAVKELCIIANAALLKGGHDRSESCCDLLFKKEWNDVLSFSKKRINTKNNHGTGCTLSSAIASYLAKGYNLETAVEEAKKYLTNALEKAKNWNIGNGNGPVNHNYNSELI